MLSQCNLSCISLWGDVTTGFQVIQKGKNHEIKQTFFWKITILIKVITQREYIPLFMHEYIAITLYTVYSP